MRVDGGDGFEEFVREVEPRLRQSLVALCGPERAQEAVQDALVYGWQNWERVGGMDNPAGYLYRVARSRVRWRRAGRRLGLPDGGPGMPEVEPGLEAALAGLSERQRVVVLLVKGVDWTYEEVAEHLGISVSSVRTHLTRGMEGLRAHLGVSIDG